MRLIKPTLDDMLHVLTFVWRQQLPEVMASMEKGEHVEDYAKRLLSQSVLSHTWLDEDGHPYAVGGWIMTDRDVVASWLFHTEAGLTSPTAILKVVRRAMQNMRTAGVHRFEAVTMENNHSERWYSVMGFRRERYIEGAGSNGETMALYVNEGN